MVKVVAKEEKEGVGSFSALFLVIWLQYRFKITNQEVIMALDSAKKQEIVAKFAKKEGDTGSPAVQIALITERIKYLTEHLKVSKKDHSSRLGLLKLVGQRKRLMKYLKRKDYATFTTVIAELGLRDK